MKEKLLFFLFIISSPFFGSAAASTEIQSSEIDTPNKKLNEKNPLKSLIADLHEVKTKFVHSDEDSRRLLGNLYIVNKKIKDMSDKRTRLTDEMLAAKGDSSTLANSIVRLEEKIKFQRQMLSRRLRTIYKIGEQSILEAIFSSQNSFQLDRNLAFLKKVAQRDYEMIQNFTNDIQELEIKKKKLKKTIQKMLRAKQYLKSQESILEAEQKSKSQLLHQLHEARQNYLSQIKGLRQKANSLASPNEVIGSPISESFFERKGQLSLPLSGPITREFGIIQNENYKFKVNHKGLFFNSPVGQPIRAVFPGHVKFAGFIDGYGLTLIIDHGDRYYTVYSYQQSLKVKNGQQVSEEEIIGETGKDLSGKEGLYFEIRHFSDPIDPKHWVKWVNENKVPPTMR